MNDSSQEGHKNLGEDEGEGLGGGGFVSEEGEIEGGVSPQKDLFSAILIALFALGATVMSLVMENPSRRFYSSPGFLPFLVGVSLFAMAAFQGLTAFRRVARQGLLSGTVDAVRRYFQDGENQSAILLIVLVLIYVVAIDLISFDPIVPLGIPGVEIRFSSFEAVTIVVLTIILRIFWKKPIFQCLIVSFLTSSSLSFAFRYGFQLIMPGVS